MQTKVSLFNLNQCSTSASLWGGRTRGKQCGFFYDYILKNVTNKLSKL